MAPLDPNNPVTPPRSHRPPSLETTGERPPTAADLNLGRASVPPVLTALPSAGGLWRALGRRWLLALFLGLLGAGLAGAALWFLLPAPFVSELRLTIRRAPSYLPGSDNGTYDDFMRSQASLLKSQRLIDNVLANDQVKGLALAQNRDRFVDGLRKTFTIKFAAGDNFLPLKLSGDDPAELAKFLGVLIEEYKKELRRERREQAQRFQAALDRADSDLKALGIPAYDPKQIDQARINLTTARAALDNAQGELDSRREVTPALDEKSLVAAVENDLRTDPDFLKLKQEFTDNQKLYTQARGVAKDPNDREVRKYWEELTRIGQAMIAYQKGYLDRKKPQLLRSLKDGQEALLRPYRDAVNRAEQQMRTATAEVTRLEGLETPEFRAKFARARALESNRSQIQEQITRINLDGDELPWVVPAGAPTQPALPDRTVQIRTAALGSAGVFVLLLFGVALVEFRSRRVTSSDEVTQGLGIPTVGTLPILPARVLRAALGTGAVRDSYWHGRLTESVDALRTFLLRSLGEGPHVVMVTSAVQGEGKTSLASQLAASLARAWRKTLLIDGDLRKPAAHKLFDLPVEPGLSEVLRGELDLGDVIRPTTVGRLWLMPAGQWDAHALQALAQEGAGNFFEQLRDEYEFIIVDSCPVLPVTDTLMLGQHVDTVLFAVLRGASRLPTLYAAWQRLAALEIPVLGAVVAGGNSAFGGLDIQYPRPSAT